MLHRFTAVAIATASLWACQNDAPTSTTKELRIEPGFMDFMAAEELDPLKATLPQVEDTELATILRDPQTMWYDEESMVFVYQDSVETVTGVRANRVGRETGERNRNNPDIAKLMHYFGEDKRFRFPFRTAAGTDDVTNVKVLNFWSPAKRDGEVLPVKWWKESPRGRWRWVHPNGTVFGEILYQQAPSGTWYPFEIRTRSRYSGGWAVDVHRPFATADALAAAIRERRQNWQSDASLREVVEHLEGGPLTPHRLASEAYAAIFEPIDGALDVIPAMNDADLVTSLLQNVTWTSTEGEIWRAAGELETYAPSSAGNYSIVPAGYKMGMIPVNEVSCNRCHQDTGRYLGEFDDRIQLYGEIWGEDRIFTWHLFKDHSGIYGTFDDADGSRQLNPRMQAAGLLEQGRPAEGNSDYSELPRRFTQIFR